MPVPRTTTALPGPAAPVTSSETRRLQRRTLTVLVIAQVIGTVGVGVGPSVGVLLAGEITQNEMWAGLARTASTLGAAFLGLPLGALAARQGRRFALSTGWWMASAGAALLVPAAQERLIVLMFAGLLLVGSGSAVSLQSRFAATDLAEPHRRGRALATVVWVGTLGSVLGPNLGLPGKMVGDAVGLTVFAGAFLIAAVCLALAGLVVFVGLRPDPLHVLAGAAGHSADMKLEGGGRRRGRLRAVARELAENQRARLAVITILTAQIVMVTIMTMTPVHLAREGGSITIIGLTISLHVAGMYALAPVVGLLTDRRGHRFTVLVGVAVFTASLVIGAVWPHERGWIVVSLILLGVGWSFVNVAGSALFTAAVSDGARASAQGGVDALSNLCGAVAAFAAGPLLVATNFSLLSVVAILVLVPLTVLMLRRAPTP